MDAAKANKQLDILIKRLNKIKSTRDMFEIDEKLYDVIKDTKYFTPELKTKINKIQKTLGAEIRELQQLHSAKRQFQRIMEKAKVMARWEELDKKKKLSPAETKEYKELDRTMKQYIRNMMPRVRLPRVRV